MHRDLRCKRRWRCVFYCWLYSSTRLCLLCYLIQSSLGSASPSLPNLASLLQSRCLVLAQQKRCKRPFYVFTKALGGVLGVFACTSLH